MDLSAWGKRGRGGEEVDGSGDADRATQSKRTVKRPTTRRRTRKRWWRSTSASACSMASRRCSTWAPLSRRLCTASRWPIAWCEPDQPNIQFTNQSITQIRTVSLVACKYTNTGGDSLPPPYLTPPSPASPLQMERNQANYNSPYINSNSGKKPGDPSI